METKLKLSHTSKMPCGSWSLQALDTCPGSRNKDGTIVPVCVKCYARKGYYRMKPTKDLRVYNKQDWKRDDWVSDFVDYLIPYALFRWFDSGDIYTPALGYKILEVCKATPWCKHWIPTKSYKFSKFNHVFDELKALPNVIVRFSSDSMAGEYTEGLHGSTVIPDPDFEIDAFKCKAYTRGHKCGSCTVCWDKSVPLVAYLAQ